MLTLCTLKTFLAKHSGATECISLISLLPLHAFNKFQANYITWKRLQTFPRFKIVLINFCFKITSMQPSLPWFSWEMSQKTRKLELSLSFFFLPALEWWIFHKCIIIITFSKLFAAFLITEQLLIKGNYQTALPHSNNLDFALLFCLVSQPSLFLHTEKGIKKRTFCTTILFLILWEEVGKGTSPFSHLQVGFKEWRRTVINNMILLADRNVSPHQILAQGQELTNDTGSVGGNKISRQQNWTSWRKSLSAPSDPPGNPEGGQILILWACLSIFYN